MSNAQKVLIAFLSVVSIFHLFLKPYLLTWMIKGPIEVTEETEHKDSVV